MGSHWAVGVGAGLSDILIDDWIAEKSQSRYAITVIDKRIVEGRPST
jgi:hypothetical protein